MHLKAKVKGPRDSVYQEGTYELRFLLPDNYPLKPPHITMMTKTFHVNISDIKDEQVGVQEFGYKICVDFLDENWTADYTLEKCLVAIQLLLDTPEPDSPLNGDAARIFKRSRAAYDRIARKYTRDFAR